MRVFFVRLLASACSLSTLASAANLAEDSPETLETVIVTAVRMTDPLRVATDPSQPRQPLPAHDGADYLKTIPGFNVIRKGGTDGDPVFRGMAASRINILLDGESLSGGCSSRMDPPTAYVFPESYDRITVIKGPQTVRYGPGNSAATVLFERDPKPRIESGWDMRGSVTTASFGRNDQVLNVNGGNRSIYANADMSRAEADDYQDGDGNSVNSAYERWSVDAAIGWTPTDDTFLELGVSRSDGEAAYADRMMDGAAFDRENIDLKFRSENLNGLITAIEGQVYHNYIDHLMDNYSLRDFTPTMMMPHRSASNPDRETRGGRLLAELSPMSDVELLFGVDVQHNQHSVRSTMNQDMMPWQQKDRVTDAKFANTGLFSELDWDLGEGRHVVGGVRFDDWRADDRRDVIQIGMMGMTVSNPTADESRNETLASGFLRYEWQLTDLDSSVMAGIGYVERFPDYWELFGVSEGESSVSAFAVEPEKTTQIDIGLLHNGERLSASVNLFANEIDDYILTQNDWQKGMRRARVSRNIDARTWGAEVSVAYAITANIQLDQSFAWVRGDNRTDDRALAQQPPLESRTALNATYGDLSVGVLMRLVDDQDRYALNQGNIVGQDLGPTEGFAIFSVNGAWKLNDQISMLAGVDNLTDQTYAEHISRGGAMVPGYIPSERVNEPGRTLWAKLVFKL